MLKKAAVIFWSISLAVILMVLTTTVMLSSTKRARIEVKAWQEANEEATAQQARDGTRLLPGTKSNGFDLGGDDVLHATTRAATVPTAEVWPLVPSSEFSVLKLNQGDASPGFSSSKLIVLPLDRAVRLAAPPATQPAAPTTGPNR